MTTKLFLGLRSLRLAVKNAAIIATNPEAAPFISVRPSDSLMKELGTIHKNHLLKNGDYHIRSYFYIETFCDIF